MCISSRTTPAAAISPLSGAWWIATPDVIPYPPHGRGIATPGDAAVAVYGGLGAMG